MRYFIELSYNGAHYSGFQVQNNANTVQQEIEKALQIFAHQSFQLTGSSRTDACVNADQNFFHFDSELLFDKNCVYNLNAILPQDIAIKRIVRMPDDAHARFSAISREYAYFVYQQKNPFLHDRAYFFPYKINADVLNEAASVIKECKDFTSFSKRNTQVKNFICDIHQSVWIYENDCWVYKVKGNRFLRGMVRGLVGTMLRVGRGYITIDDLKNIIASRDCTRADFSAPGHALFLKRVNYPDDFFRS